MITGTEKERSAIEAAEKAEELRVAYEHANSLLQEERKNPEHEDREQELGKLISLSDRVVKAAEAYENAQKWAKANYLEATQEAGEALQKYVSDNCKDSSSYTIDIDSDFEKLDTEQQAQVKKLQSQKEQLAEVYNKQFALLGDDKSGIVRIHNTAKQNKQDLENELRRLKNPQSQADIVKQQQAVAEKQNIIGAHLLKRRAAISDSKSVSTSVTNDVSVDDIARFEPGKKEAPKVGKLQINPDFAQQFARVTGQEKPEVVKQSQGGQEHPTDTTQPNPEDLTQPVTSTNEQQGSTKPPPEPPPLPGSQQTTPKPPPDPPPLPGQQPTFKAPPDPPPMPGQGQATPQPAQPQQEVRQKVKIPEGFAEKFAAARGTGAEKPEVVKQSLGGQPQPPTDLPPPPEQPTSQQGQPPKASDLPPPPPPLTGVNPNQGAASTGAEDVRQDDSSGPPAEQSGAQPPDYETTKVPPPTFEQSQKHTLPGAAESNEGNQTLPPSETVDPSTFPPPDVLPQDVTSPQPQEMPPPPLQSTQFAQIEAKEHRRDFVKTLLSFDETNQQNVLSAQSDESLKALANSLYNLANKRQQNLTEENVPKMIALLETGNRIAQALSDRGIEHPRANYFTDVLKDFRAKPASTAQPLQTDPPEQVQPSAPPEPDTEQLESEVQRLEHQVKGIGEIEDEQERKKQADALMQENRLLQAVKGNKPLAELASKSKEEIDLALRDKDQRKNYWDHLAEALQYKPTDDPGENIAQIIAMLLAAFTAAVEYGHARRLERKEERQQQVEQGLQTSQGEQHEQGLEDTGPSSQPVQGQGALPQPADGPSMTQVEGGGQGVTQPQAHQANQNGVAKLTEGLRQQLEQTQQVRLAQQGAENATGPNGEDPTTTVNLTTDEGSSLVADSVSQGMQTQFEPTAPPLSVASSSSSSASTLMELGTESSDSHEISADLTNRSQQLTSQLQGEPSDSLDVDALLEVEGEDPQRQLLFTSSTSPEAEPANKARKYNENDQRRQVQMNPDRPSGKHTTDARQIYDQVYGQNFYQGLAETIEKSAKSVKVGAFDSKIKDTHFMRCREIAKQLEFARQGAIAELQELPPDTPPEQVMAQQAKIDVAEKLRDNYRSMSVLSYNGIRQEKSSFMRHANDIHKLMKDNGLEDNEIGRVLTAFQETQKNELFNKRKFYQTRWGGSVGYDSSKENQSLDDKYSSHFYVGHKGTQVEPNFTYSRSSLLSNKGVSKAGGGFTNEKRKFLNEIEASVVVSINEHDKGSKHNPINIVYGTDKKGRTVAQPEMALALLMEFKKRAVLDDKTFHVKGKDGQLIEITPSRELSADEKALFTGYAMERSYKDGYHKSKSYGGEITLGTKASEAIKEGDTAKVTAMLQSHVINVVDDALKKEQGKLDSTAENLQRQQANKKMRM